MRLMTIALASTLFSLGCATAPARPAATPRPAATTVIVPPAADPAFVVRVSAPDPAVWAEERNLPTSAGSLPIAYKAVRRDGNGQISVLFAPASAGGMRAIATALHSSFASDTEQFLTEPLTTGATDASFGFAGIGGPMDGESGRIRVVRTSLMTDAIMIVAATWKAPAGPQVTAAAAALRDSVAVIPMVPAGDPRMALAACLTERGVRLYSASWCGHCAHQAEMFGRAYSRVMVTECSPDGAAGTLRECREAGVSSFPTWRMPDGTTMSGTQSMADLAARAGCAWSGSE